MNELFVIEAVGLSKVYWDGGRKLQILKNATLSIKQGEAVAVLGPSGSGKTTLLNLLSGLDTPDEGTVRLDGREWSRMSEGEKAGVRNRLLGFVFQFYHLLPEFTALENVQMPAWIGRQKRPEAELRGRAEALLGRVKLSHRLNHYPSELSGGEQQRVALARSLMNDPKIVFCDEPTGNLDPATAAEVTELIRDLFVKEKKTVLLVTHDPNIAAMAGRVWDTAQGAWRN